MNIGGTDKTTNMTYAHLAKLTLNIPPREGWTRKEMKLRYKIEDKLDLLEIGEETELEDAEFEKIRDLANQPWQFKDREIIKYMDDLDEWFKEE